MQGIDHTFDCLASYLAPPVYEALVTQSKPRAMVHRLQGDKRGGETVFVDTIRCRRNALYHSNWPWPRFSVLDSIQPVDGPCELLPGFYFIEAPRKGQRRIDGGAAERVLRAPLRGDGNGWVSAPTLACSLDHGIIT